MDSKFFNILVSDIVQEAEAEEEEITDAAP